MGRTACTETQCLYKGALYLFTFTILLGKLRLLGSITTLYIKCGGCVIKWDKEWWHSKWLLPISSDYSAIHLKNHQKVVTVNHCPSSAWNGVPPQIYARHQAYPTDVRNILYVFITEGQEIYGFNLKIGYISYQVQNLCYFQINFNP